jgi:hypothetical protein
MAHNENEEVMLGARVPVELKERFDRTVWSRKLAGEDITHKSLLINILSEWLDRQQTDQRQNPSEVRN